MTSACCKKTAIVRQRGARKASAAIFSYCGNRLRGLFKTRRICLEAAPGCFAVPSVSTFAFIGFSIKSLALALWVFLTLFTPTCRTEKLPAPHGGPRFSGSCSAGGIRARPESNPGHLTRGNTFEKPAKKPGLFRAVFAGGCGHHLPLRQKMPGSLRPIAVEKLGNTMHSAFQISWQASCIRMAKQNRNPWGSP